MEEGVATNLVDGTSVTIVGIEVLLRIRHGALMNGAFLSRGEVVNVLLTILGEVNRQTTSVNEGHATTFLLGLSAGIGILSVWVSLTLKLHKLGVFETLAEGPLDNLTITGDGDKGFTLVFTLDPLDIPNNVSMLEFKILGLSNGLSVRALNVVNSDVTTGVTNSNEMGCLLGETAANNARVVHNQLLGEVRVLKGPEAKETGLKLGVINNVDVVLTVPNSNKIWVGYINVNAGDLAALSNIALESEKGLQGDSAFLDLFLFLLVVVLLLDLFLDAHRLFLVALFLVVGKFILAKIHWWVILVQNVLFVEGVLGKQTLNNFNCLHDRLGKVFVNVFGVLLDLAVGTTTGGLLTDGVGL